MWSKYQVVAVAMLTAGVVGAQEQAIPQNAVKFNLPDNAPLSVRSATMQDSRATSRGAALVLDLHMALTLRNESPTQRIHGVTLRVVAQEVTLGGKGSVTYPSLDVGPGESFPVRVDMQLLKPSQMAGGSLVQVDLDGVLFQNLSFYGPDRLNSKRALTACEMEAQRDRAYFKRILASAGKDGLRREMLESLNRQTEAGQMTVAVSRSGRAVSGLAVAERREEFAFLRFPDSPINPTSGSVQLAGNEARAPRIEVENLSNRPVKYVEMGWIVSDASGKTYMAGSLPSADHDITLAPRSHMPLLQQTTLNFTSKGHTVQVQRMLGFVNQVEFTDGKIWVPSRESLASDSMLKVLPPSAEEQRLSDMYRRRGLDALMAELNKF